MVQYYPIFGRQIGSHYLAITTLSLLFVGTYASMGTSKAAAQKTTTPPINANSPDEESFIKDFLKNAEKK